MAKAIARDITPALPDLETREQFEDLVQQEYEALWFNGTEQEMRFWKRTGRAMLGSYVREVLREHVDKLPEGQ